MPQKWKFFLKDHTGKLSTIYVYQDASIADLKDKVELATLVPKDNQLLISTGKQLSDTDPYGEPQMLSDYPLVDESNIFLVMRLPGGSAKKVPPPEAELTKEMDMLTLDNIENTMKMPCGCPISPESLTSYCLDELSKRKLKFSCPQCNQQWDVKTVRRFSVLSKEEMDTFETELNKNYVRTSSEIQQCPKCDTYCTREDENDVCVRCLMCSEEDDFDFCWLCLKKWASDSTTSCGNKSCSTERFEILHNASTKTIGDVENCPTIRACPTCCMLIEHKEACKHMTCECGTDFCFICLNVANVDGDFDCGDYNTSCRVASVQTE